MFGFSKHLIPWIFIGAILASAGGCGGAGQTAVPPDPVKAQEAQNKAMDEAKVRMQKEMEVQKEKSRTGMPSGAGGPPSGPRP
jgi:predicted small lipoprotein YifL